jgi:hypothetical protein
MKRAMKLLAAAMIVTAFVSLTGCLDHVTGPCGQHHHDRDTATTQTDPAVE